MTQLKLGLIIFLFWLKYDFIKIILISLKDCLVDIEEGDFEILEKEFRWQGVSEELIQVIPIDI